MRPFRKSGVWLKNLLRNVLLNSCYLGEVDKNMEKLRKMEIFI